MRPAGRVQHDPGGAGPEMRPGGIDDAVRDGARSRSTRRRTRPRARQVEHLPGRSIERRRHRRGLRAAQLDRVGVEGAADPVQLVDRQVDGDRDDGRTLTGRGDGPEVRGEGDRLAQLERSRRSGDQVQPDRVGAGPHRGLDAGPVGDAADLHERDPVEVRGVGGHPAGADERPRLGLGVGGAHERLADQRRVEAEGAPATDRRDVPHARFRDHQAILGHRRPEARRTFRIDGQRAQVAVVDPDQASRRRERGVQLPLVMRLDERFEAEVEGARHEPAELRAAMQDREQQHDVGTGRPEQVELARLDDELLRQHRHRHGGADRREIGDGATEPVGFAQDGDRDRAAALVRARPSDDVLVRGPRSRRPTATTA